MYFQLRYFKGHLVWNAKQFEHPPVEESVLATLTLGLALETPDSGQPRMIP